MRLAQRRIRPANIVASTWTIPGFIADRTWDFERKLTEPATAPRGFDASAATDGVRLNGFYLFQSFREQTINIRQ